ncbi:LacI family DNA-binding transcriptional regulator [Solwaraspora sp. WMMD406]|uniref:LacI family DNA-binding transcriptional regulator n=1 Tax=Solwaraspora sp. WMMD406 TaxID=3016095 RepID=UPI0024164822|nr:LacI family DNA-binding transcriptional regulator [Solwaraspora sp. WMMD406]MDG4767551.1 LacI family DNA-binding transcriptional regulator [Solwaraspora sp. WMMD406]
MARKAEVSPATVSRVVNGHANVDPVLADRVRRAMNELGYRPNAVARNLRRSRTTLWAVVISDIGNPFFTALVRGVEDIAQRSGFSVVLCNTDEDPTKEARYLNAVLAEQVAGVIIAPSGPQTDLDQLAAARVPVVVIDRQLHGSRIDTVLVENEHGAELATAHLVESGYQRIACITGRRGVYTASSRLAGYRRALTAAGHHYDERLVRYADFRSDGGYQAMSELLRCQPRPDALFVANNLMTVGALECLVDNGITVPADMGVVGFDDLPWAHLVRPALTTVAQPTYQLGETAGQLLTERIATPDRDATTVTLPTKLQVRESSTRRPGPSVGSDPVSD